MKKRKVCLLDGLCKWLQMGGLSSLITLLERLHGLIPELEELVLCQIKLDELKMIWVLCQKDGRNVSTPTEECFILIIVSIFYVHLRLRILGNLKKKYFIYSLCSSVRSQIPEQLNGKIQDCQIQVLLVRLYLTLGTTNKSMSTSRVN